MVVNSVVHKAHPDFFFNYRRLNGVDDRECLNSKFQIFDLSI